MKHTTIARIIAFLLLSTLLLSSCKRSQDYRQDVNLEELNELITPLLSHPETLVRYDSDQIRFFLGLPEAYYTDALVMVQTRSDSVDEYGIFRCNSAEDADELEDLLDDYLEIALPGKLAYLNGREAPSYSDEEDEAFYAHDTALTGRVRCYGNYVCYTLLSKEADNALQSKLRSIL